MSDIKKVQPSKKLVKLSKLLSLTLRHKAIDQGFKINTEGYINLKELVILFILNKTLILTLIYS
jgi:RNA:NAD 2'-phosphotransferase (TPT1/KptA family)